MQIRPRSGLALKHGITLPNTPGTIDSDYRGPLGVLLVNLGAEPYTVHHGDRIAQTDRRARGAGGVRGGDRAWRHRAGRGRLRVHGPRLMILVLLLAAVIWGVGVLMKTPVAAAPRS